MRCKYVIMLLLKSPSFQARHMSDLETRCSESYPLQGNRELKEV
jgi:hypothetical protein